MRVDPPLGVTDELDTPRLRLRQWRSGDWSALHRAYGDPEVMRWHGRPDGLSLEETAYAVGRMSMHWDARGFGMWAVEERDGGDLVGRIGLLYHPDSPAGEDRVEIAWSLQQDRWGRGYATEGALAVRDWTFRRLDIPRLISITIPENRRSWHVMEKLGLTRRGTAHWHDFDVEWWALDRPDWVALAREPSEPSPSEP
jgi:RimJ/RimL family protein N-acetyltransferase